jgi:heme/copper-type cytochrome/quinol oxidase subunit 3
MSKVRAAELASPYSTPPPIGNATLGMMLFVAAELMLFVGLISGYVVLRYGSHNFEGLPRMPLPLPAVNTCVILLSSLALLAVQRSMRAGDSARLKSGALAALLLGTLFLALQAVEWRTLLTSGWLPRGSIASGLFYLLSGMHGLHIVGGLVLLTMLWSRIARGATRRSVNVSLRIASIYWHFVSLVWLALFTMMFIL